MMTKIHSENKQEIIATPLTAEEKQRYPSLAGYDENGKPVFKKKIKEVNILNKRSGAEKVLYGVVFGIMLFHCITLVAPVIWMFISSLKRPFEYSSGNPFAMPETPLFSNYIKAFQMLNVGETNFFGMIFNSLWYTLIKTFLNVMIPAFCGYVMSRYKFFGRELLFSYILLIMVLPLYGSGGATMKLIGDLGVYDSPLYVIVTNLGGFGTSFIVWCGFFKSIGLAYAEAAKIDGANAFQIYFRIMLPQAFPVLMTYGITGAIDNWNAYNDMILYIPSYPTLASGLFEYQSNAIRGANYPVYFAGILISAIPPVLLFSLFSDKVMTSLSIGGLKG